MEVGSDHVFIKNAFGAGRDVKFVNTLSQIVLCMYRQSPVKNQPINHKVDNLYVLTKVPHNMRTTYLEYTHDFAQVS